ncbi:TonB-dependent receptor [Marinicella sp. S1101]|uniref:TonB-dependent receptor plug domain-containing protein n=1 Tax=Marinicella marina TaxID=2996016 RepID=UPI002260DA3D|nr:TonB-dependent receptor [Marinicella marina]MCX7553227.1 TonB-dependent receptor [Marinicella marina]MDJ1138959.1 TonB-dependent receptor [Marinicella marina]
MKYTFLLLLIANNAFAQEISGEEDQSKDIETLAPLQVTASKTATSTNDSATAVSVVTRDEIKNKPNTLLPDLLRQESGVYIQQTTPGQAIPIIRGLKGSQNVHLVDGMRLNTAFFRNAPNQYLALVDSFMTSQIEVVRGPSSVLYGGDALGGVVNVLTHTPEFYSSEWDITGQVYSSWDSADEKWISHAGADFGNNKIASTIGISYQDIGQRTTGSGQNIPFTAYTSRSINNKWVFNTSDSSNWIFDIQYTHQPSTPRVDNLVAGFGESEPESRVFEFQPNERLFSHLKYTSANPTGWYDMANYHVAYQKITDNRFSQPLSGNRTDTEQNNSELLSLQADWNKAINDTNMLVYGFDTYVDTISSARQRVLADGTEVPRDPRYPDQSKMQQFAIYADWHQYLGDHELTLGGRLSDYDIDLNSPQISDDQLDLTDFTWHASWLYKINDADRVFVNVGRGFRPPNIFDLGQVGERSGNRFNIINPDLDPESVLSFDVGFKHAGNGWQAEIVAFVSRYQDVIASVETGELTADERIVVQSQNINEVDIYGIESELNYYFDNGGHLFANVTYTHGTEDTSDGEGPADRIPPTFGVIGYQQDISTEWNLRSQVRFAETQDRLSARDLRDARINPFGTGGFVVYDTHFTWRPAINSQIRLGVENIFDKKYREHASGLDAPGRNYHASFYYDF